MSDVRLVATNPEDSSVVPVGCNARGELLIVEPVIEQIDNDVTITGSLQAGTGDDVGTSTLNGVSFWGDKGTVVYQAEGAESSSWSLRKDGYARFNKDAVEGYGQVRFNNNLKGISVHNQAGTNVWSVDYTGNTRASSLMLQLEPSNPANFKTVVGDEESATEYIGPELDVLKALVALKNEVQLLEEKLKMVPSSGWEVWDGSSAV